MLKSLLKGENLTVSRKRQSTEYDNDSNTKLDSETSSGRNRGKRQRCIKSPDAISIASDSEDKLAKLVGTAGKNTDGEITKMLGNEPKAQEHDFLDDFTKTSVR